MSGGNQFDWMSCLSIENEILMTVDMDDLVFEATMNAYVDPSLNGSTRFNSTRLDSTQFCFIAHASTLDERSIVWINDLSISQQFQLKSPL